MEPLDGRWQPRPGGGRHSHALSDTIAVSNQRSTPKALNIDYVIQGQGFPVSLLHVRPVTWFSRRKQIPALAQRFQVAALDMRGPGDSENPLDGYDTRKLAAVVRALLQSLGNRRLELLAGTHPPEELEPQAPAAVRERRHSFFHQIPNLPEAPVPSNGEAYLRHF